MLLNLINVKMVPYIKQNKLIFDISVDVYIFFWILLQLIVYSVLVMFIVSHMMHLLSFVSECSPYAFINVLASNHTVELINSATGTATAIPPWIGEHQEINTRIWIDAGPI